jgi:hypothetical protein
MHSSVTVAGRIWFQLDEDRVRDALLDGLAHRDPASGALKDPAATWDYMSYCGDADSTWTSDYNYRASLELFTGQAGPDPVAWNQQRPARTRPGDAFSVISGCLCHAPTV